MTSRRDLLLRIARRRASWEVSTDDAFAVECCISGSPELRFSVYRVDDARTHTIRIYAEHHATSKLDPPPKTRRHIDASSSLEAVAEVVESPFSFLRSAHHVLPFEDTAQLRDFFDQLVDEFDARHREVTKDEAQSYVLDRHSQRDPEWSLVVERQESWRRWIERETKTG